MADSTCNYRWRAPRHDVPRSADVEHVCILRLGHEFRVCVEADTFHRCSCRAHEAVL